MNRSHRSRAERGNALVEFALGWAVFWLLFAGTYQFGYSFYIYNVLMTACANAAELGSKLDYDAANPSAYTTTLQNMVLYGSPTAGTRTLAPNLAASNVSVVTAPASGTACNGSGSSPCPQYVTISITNYSTNAVFTSFTWNGKPRVTVAYIGHVICSGC